MGIIQLTDIKGQKNTVNHCIHLYESYPIQKYTFFYHFDTFAHKQAARQIYIYINILVWVLWVNLTFLVNGTI